MNEEPVQENTIGGVDETKGRGLVWLKDRSAVFHGFAVFACSPILRLP